MSEDLKAQTPEPQNRSCAEMMALAALLTAIGTVLGELSHLVAALHR